MKYFKHKLPVLFRGDSTLLDEKAGVKKVVRRLFLKYVYAHVDVALYTGTANNAYFKAHGLNDCKLEFMPHAVDNKRFEPSSKNFNEAVSLRQKLNISKEATVFLFAGKLEEKKQPDFLGKIFCEITNEHTFLLIVGNGNLEKDLKEKYIHHPQIRFLDFVNQQEIPSVYASCDVFILPSKGPGETWGLSINEAMAGGKAVIVSNACGAAYDLIVNDTNGFIFEKNNPEMLKSYMKFIQTNKILAVTMGENSLKLIQPYSFEKDCMAIENVLLNKISK